MDNGKSVSWGSPRQSQQDEDTERRHAEEAYGTPPYGQPGPWAPAPPVQRPEPTPPAGTRTSPPAAPAGTPAGQTPAAGTPTGQAPAGAAPGTAPAPRPTPMGTPPTGTPMPPARATAPPQAHAAPAAHAPAPAAASLPGEPLRRYDPWGGTAGGGVPLPGVPGAAPAGVPPAGASERPRPLALVAGAALIALLAGLVGGAIGVQMERDGTFNDDEVQLPQSSPDDGPAPEGSIAGIAEDVLPGVVTLHVSGAEAAGTGTGFVLDDEGHILTNAHVVEPAGDGGVIEVTFSSGDTAQAEVIGSDAGYDLAVVEVSGVSGLSPLELGDSDSVRVGDPVIAFGAPFDLAGTVTSGIISATERPITAGGSEPDGSDISYVNALQTDAPINPGNSGGPLVDISGRVIGINSAIRTADSGGFDSGSSGSVGLGFAIPINQGRDVAEQLINVGYATHPVIGVMLDTGYAGEGAMVGSTTPGEEAVTPGGPADQAGVQEGDLITAVDGEPVRTGDELIVKIRSHQPGDRLALTIERGGEEMQIDVVLGEETGS
ncbi:trypsin-like peptidase domain-containing protein [Streptomyces sp. 6N223]|uniref:trypsin-like peptidase domain-containing protein n=1 Tax=Streptomyces sp. 6N223 TaxID=3457412 RepID=UPI003FCF6FB5